MDFTPWETFLLPFRKQAWLREIYYLTDFFIPKFQPLLILCAMYVKLRSLIVFKPSTVIDVSMRGALLILWEKNRAKIKGHCVKCDVFNFVKNSERLAQNVSKMRSLCSMQGLCPFMKLFWLFKNKNSH